MAALCAIREQARSHSDLGRSHILCTPHILWELARQRWRPVKQQKFIRLPLSLNHHPPHFQLR
jgi:hypothetical protein